MNCFELQSRTSDFLDGTLIGADKLNAENHLDTCAACSTRFKHYRVLLSTLSNAPRSTRPIPSARPQASTLQPKRDPLAIRTRRLWRRMPWYLQTSLEGAGIVFFVLLAISTGPRLITIYDRYIEQSVSEFNQNMLDPTSETSPPQLPDGPAMTKGKLGAPESGTMEQDVTQESPDFAGETEIEDSTEDTENLRVGNSEIWRFNLKTDSPKEIRNRIVQILSELKIPSDTPGLGGIEAPGGIQFDVVIPQTAIPGLKRQLQRIAPKAPEMPTKRSGIETFAWYRNKSKKVLPSGKTRVVIWLSQI